MLYPPACPLVMALCIWPIPPSLYSLWMTCPVLLSATWMAMILLESSGKQIRRPGGKIFRTKEDYFSAHRRTLCGCGPHLPCAPPQQRCRSQPSGPYKHPEDSKLQTVSNLERRIGSLKNVLNKSETRLSTDLIRIFINGNRFGECLVRLSPHEQKCGAQISRWWGPHLKKSTP